MSQVATTESRRLFDEVFGAGKDGGLSDYEALQADVARLGLRDNIGELELRGYTVVPPEKVAPPEFVSRLREAILDVAERRGGVRPDPRLAETQGGTPFGQMLPYLALEAPVFQEAVLNPVALTLATYLLGRSAMLYNCIGFLKGPGGDDLPLHSDNVMIPPPFGAYAHLCNATWVLSDFSAENGSTCFVPGSHRHNRPPMPGEGVDARVAVDAPAGSMVFWHGHTWHGALARTAPGMRISMPMTYCRMYLRPQEAYRENVTQEILERNPRRFATLMGQHLDYGWKEEGPDFAKIVGYPRDSTWE